MKTLLAMSLLAMVLAARSTQAATTEPADASAVKTWMAGTFDKEKPTAPFSFRYGDQEAVGILPTWPVTSEKKPEADGSRFEIVWTCPKTGACRSEWRGSNTRPFRWLSGCCT